MNLDPNLVRQILMPAIAGAAGTGALSAYISKNHHPANEDPRQRRRRIMRNAGIGATLGGAAGAALPTGLDMLSEPFREGGKPILDDIVDGGTGLVADNAAGLGVLGAGGYALNKHVQQRRGKAVSGLMGLVGKGNTEIPDAENLRSLMSTAEGQQKVISNILGKSPGGAAGGQAMNNVFRGNELLQEAGSKGLSIDEISKLFQPLHAQSANNARGAFQSFLAEQGPISRLVSKMVPKTDNIPHTNVSPARLAELYSRYVRPSLKRTPPVALAGLLGAGALGANSIQNRITG